MADGAGEGNLADLIRDAAVRHGDRPALIGDELRRTWADLDAAVDAGAAALIDTGLQPGARVVVALAGSDLLAGLLATARAGLVAVPVDPTRTDLAAIGGRVSAAAVLAKPTGPNADDPDLAAHRFDVALTPSDVARWWSAGAGSPVEPRCSGEDLALVARATDSGRAVMLPHRAVLSAVAAILAAPGLGLRESDRVLQALPLHHLSGFVTAFLPLTMAGAAAVLPSGPGAAAALATVRAHKVTIVPAAPGLFHEFTHEPGVDRALASVRLMTAAAAPLDPADFAAIRRLTGQPVWEGYGVSESSSVVSSSLMTGAARLGSVGLALDGIQVRIAGGGEDDDEADGDEIVADLAGEGEVGRIEISGSTLFAGYWPDGSGGPGPDGWFVTGDYGYLDDRGELHLVDRAAETLTVAGFTVYPREVEEVLADHPYVAGAAVVGVPGRAGDDVVAVLVAQPGTRPTPDDLDEFVATRLPAFKRPVRYQVVDVLPRRELGRVDREAVRRAYAEAEDIDLTQSPDAPLAAVAGPSHEVAAPADGAKADGVEQGDAEADGAESDADDQEAEPDEGPDVAPEPAADLDELGQRLPGRGHETGRGAQDTDDDLFGDEVG